MVNTGHSIDILTYLLLWQNNKLNFIHNYHTSLGNF